MRSYHVCNAVVDACRSYRYVAWSSWSRSSRGPATVNTRSLQTDFLTFQWIVMKCCMNKAWYSKNTGADRKIQIQNWPNRHDWHWRQNWLILQTTWNSPLMYKTNYILFDECNQEDGKWELWLRWREGRKKGRKNTRNKKRKRRHKRRWKRRKIKIEIW